MGIAELQAGIRRTLMTIPLRDRGNYYRSLLVLIRRDRHIDDRERQLMIRFGQVLDFDRRFCEIAMNDLPKNKYIRDEPTQFSSRATAECFIRDAALLALVDGELHPKELDWLEAVSDANGLDNELLHSELNRLCGSQRTMNFIQSHLRNDTSLDAIGRSSEIS
jgi:hypothetical protein